MTAEPDLDDIEGRLQRTAALLTESETVLALIARIRHLEAEVANWRKPYEIQPPAGALTCNRCGITFSLGTEHDCAEHVHVGWPR